MSTGPDTAQAQISDFANRWEGILNENEGEISSSRQFTRTWCRYGVEYIFTADRLDNDLDSYDVQSQVAC